MSRGKTISCICKKDILMGMDRRRNFKKAQNYRGVYYRDTGVVMISVPVGSHGGTRMFFSIDKIKEYFIII